MILKKIKFLSWIIFFVLLSPAYAHTGFTADKIFIHQLPSGNYLITIQYTNLDIGEFREAKVQFKLYDDAIIVYKKLVNGAQFYWGDSKNIQFIEEKIKKEQP